MRFRRVRLRDVGPNHWVAHWSGADIHASRSIDSWRHRPDADIQLFWERAENVGNPARDWWCMIDMERPRGPG